MVALITVEAERLNNVLLSVYRVASNLYIKSRRQHFILNFLNTNNTLDFPVNTPVDSNLSK